MWSCWVGVTKRGVMMWSSVDPTCPDISVVMRVLRALWALWASWASWAFHDADICGDEWYVLYELLTTPTGVSGYG